MLKTKDRILIAALKQLNEQGLEKVSIRSIADEVGISAGNLAYHFKNIDVIIYQLYLELVGEFSKSIDTIMSMEPGLELMINQAEINFKLMWKYKFLLLDFTAITRRIPEVREHFRQLVTMRKMQFSAIFQVWIEQGIVHEEQVEGLYDKLIINSIILSDAWIPDAQIHFNRSSEEIPLFYADLLVVQVVPLLTEKGLEEYKKIMKGRKPVPKLQYPEDM